MSHDLVTTVANFVQSASNDTVHQVLQILNETQNMTSERILSHILVQIRQPDLRYAIENIFAMTNLSDTELVASLILMISVSLETKQQIERTRKIDLVWTGPQSSSTNIRRIDEALIEIIASAQSSITIVSFAVYKAERIMQSIDNALNRGVHISLYLETLESSGGKISFDTLSSLYSTIRNHADIYVWPLNKRSKTIDGAYGALHAKIACVDEASVVISSANITGYAMELNMESGLLIHDAILGRKISSHLKSLVDDQIFELL